MVQNMMNLRTFYKKLSNSSKNEFDGSSFVLELSNTDKPEAVERIEDLNNGDAIKLDFVRSEGKIIANVYNYMDEQIGTIASYADYIWELGRSGELEIDRIEATNVIPVSKRKKGSKKAVVGAKFYLSESCVMKSYLYSDEDFDSETDVEELFIEEDIFDDNTDVEELFVNNLDEEVSQSFEEQEQELQQVAANIIEEVSDEPSEDVLDGEEFYVSEESEDDEEAYLSEESEDDEEAYVSEESENDEEFYVPEESEDDEEAYVSEESDVSDDVHASEEIAVSEDNDNSQNVVSPVSEPVYDENNLIDAREDMKRKFFVTQRFDTIDSIKAEIRQIMDEGIWDTRVALKNREINSKIMIEAMFKSLNILRTRRITDYLFLKFVLDNVIGQYEMLSEALKKIHISCGNMAEALSKEDKNSETFLKGKKEIDGFISSNDQFLLNMAENLDKLWNSIPKNESLDEMIERTFAIMTEVYEISKMSVVLKDAEGNVAHSFNYVSATILKDYYEKWTSIYEYLPFIKKKKLAFYESELEAVNNEINEIKQHYDELRNEKNDAIKAVKEEVQECEAHLSSMSIFSFNSKKTYRERIEELIKEEEQLKIDIDEINTEFNDKIREPIVKAETIKSKISWYSAD